MINYKTLIRTNGSMNLIKKSRLHFKKGTSDKIYEIDLCELSTQRENRYLVNFRYGRRGQKLREGTKTPDAVILQTAQKLFDSVLVSKTNKGYIEHMDTVDTPNQSKSAPNKTSLESLIKSLVNNLQAEKDSKKRARIIWRMGEIGMPLIMPEVKSSIGRGHWLEDYSIAWAIGRCGSAADISDIEMLKKSPHKNVKHIAIEAYLKLVPEQTQIHWLKDDLLSIPEDFAGCLTSGTDQISQKLLTWYQQSQSNDTDKGDLLPVLYRLSYQYPNIRHALFKLIKVISFKPGLFRGIRRIFKAAEFRQDTQLFATLCFRFETATEYFYSDWDWCYLQGSGGIKPSKELKRPDSRLAYSQKTRHYFRRRCWRNLRRMGELEAITAPAKTESIKTISTKPEYVDFATEILLTMSDSLAAEPKRSEVYAYTDNWTRELKSVNEYGPFAAFWSFNHIIYANSENYSPSKNAKTWIKTGTEDHSTRTEKHPELWQQKPQNTLRLLLESGCHPVHQFASKLFSEQKAFYSEITIEQLIIMLEKKYSETNRLSLSIIKQRLADLPYDGSLFYALFNSTLAEARELAKTEISKHQIEWMKDLDFIAKILFVEHKDIIDWRQTNFSHLNFVMTEQDAILEKLINYAFEFKIQQTQQSNITAFIKRYLSTGANNLPMTLIEKMMNTDQSTLQCLAVELLLLGKLSLENIPITIYQKITESPFTQVRALGIKLLGKQTDQQLLTKPATLLRIYQNGEHLERKSAGELILRLAKVSAEFSIMAIRELLNFAFCAEKLQEQHQDLEDLIGIQLNDFHHLVDSNQVWRLLQAKSRCAQRVGSAIIQSRNHLLFSVRQWAVLGGHNELSVRKWVENAYNNNIECVKEYTKDALRILDSDWLDCREFAFDYFRKQFDEQQWNSDAIIFVVDNNHDDVQAFGREILQSYFDQDQGAEYLIKLSQHPSENVQLFASNFLEEYASGEIKRIEQLKFYFISVLSQVNKARICKDRIVKFLMAEACQYEAVARLVFEIFSRQSVTIVIRDKAKLIQSLLKLKQQYPFLSGPLRIQAKPIWQPKENA